MTVRVIDALDEFIALKEAYTALGGDGMPHTPYSSHRWLAAWWETYQRLGEVRAFCVYDGNRLALLLPLLFARGTIGRIPVRKASYLGGGWGRVEVRHRAPPREWLDEFVTWLDGPDAPEWSVLRLGPADAQDPVALALARAFERRHQKWTRTEVQAPYLELAPTWEAFAQTRSRNFRRTVKRKQSAAAGAGLTVRRIIDPTAADIQNTVGRVSATSWQGRQGLALANTEDGVRFYGRVASTTGEFAIDLVVLEASGHSVGYLLGMRQGGVFHAFDTGFLPEYAEYSPGSLLHYSLLQMLCDGSGVEFNFGHAHTYKERFDPAHRTMIELEFYRSSLVAGLAAAVAWARRRHATLLRRDAPPPTVADAP